MITAVKTSLNRLRRALAQSTGGQRVVMVGTLLIVIFAIGAYFVMKSAPASELDKAQKTVRAASVEYRKLVSQIVARATVTTHSELPVTCYPLGAKTDVKVFTQPPKADSSIVEGEVLAAVNGRPVLVLVGETAAFREMTPGIQGVDVEQLQDGLKRLGYRTSDPRGVYGASTQSAVAKWYAKTGFTAAGPDHEQASRLRAAKEAVASAEASIENAKRALHNAGKGPSRSAVLAAEHNLAKARKALATAAPEDLDAAKMAVEIAQSELDELRQAPDTSAESAALVQAQRAKRVAEQELAEISASSGITVPFCEVIFAPKLPATVTNVNRSGVESGGRSGESEGGGADGGADGKGWATLAPGDLVLRAELRGTEPEHVKVGDEVSYRRADADADEIGTISEIQPGGADLTTIIIKGKTGFKPEERGTNLRIAIQVAATDTAVLAVPVAAVTGTPDGQAKVVKQTQTGLVDVVVRPGLSADGFLEVTPNTPDDLKAGDLVVIGQ